MNAAIIAEYTFRLQYVDDDGHVLRDVRVASADFGRAIEHTRFDMQRRGLVTGDSLPAHYVRIAPVFPPHDSSSPRTSGFCVTVVSSATEHTCQFDDSYFRSTAKRVRAECLRTRELLPEQRLIYQLNALLDDEERVAPVNRLGISLEPPTRVVGIRSGRRRDFGPSRSWYQPTPDDIPVLVDGGVLEEIVEEARAGAECEIGGFLVGHVLRDQEHLELFVVVTGWVSASGTTTCSQTSVTLTPASFAHVKRIIELRGAGETVVGWGHSHPFRLCAECPLPTPADCIAKVLFYSLDDIHVMETTFSQPYMVGLVAGVDPRIETALGHLPVKLYGWRNGEIKERGFETVSAITS